VDESKFACVTWAKSDTPPIGSSDEPVHAATIPSLKGYLRERNLRGAENDKIAEQLLDAMTVTGISYIHSSGATTEMLLDLVLNFDKMVDGGTDISLSDSL